MKNSFNIICVYRPPNFNAISHEQICILFDITQRSSNSSIIIGDFNLQTFNWKEYTFPIRTIGTIGTIVTQKDMHYFTIRLLKKIFSQLINKPTRSNNIIDLLFTNEKQLLSNINI